MGKSCSAKVGLKFHLCYDASLKVPCSMGSGGPLGVSQNWSADVDDFWCGDGSTPVNYQPFGGMNIRLPAIFDVNDTHFDGHRTTVLPWWGFNLLASYLHQCWKTVMVLGRVKLQRANTPHCLWNFTRNRNSRTLAPISSYIPENRCRHRHAVNSNKAIPSKCNASFWWHLLKSAGNPILSETGWCGKFIPALCIVTVSWQIVINHIFAT